MRYLHQYYRFAWISGDQLKLDHYATALYRAGISLKKVKFPHKISAEIYLRDTLESTFPGISDVLRVISGTSDPLIENP